MVGSLSFSYKKSPSTVAWLEAEPCASTWLGLGESACHLARPSLNPIKGLVFIHPQLQNSVSSFRRSALRCQRAHDANLIEMEWATQKDHAPLGIPLPKLWRWGGWAASTLHHLVEQLYLLLLVQDQARSLQQEITSVWSLNHTL